jgi:hypothetical protein
MRKIENDNITFRVTTDLKSRLTEFCLESPPQLRGPSPGVSQIPQGADGGGAAAPDSEPPFGFGRSSQMRQAWCKLQA